MYTPTKKHQRLNSKHKLLKRLSRLSNSETVEKRSFPDALRTTTETCNFRSISEHMIHFFFNYSSFIGNNKKSNENYYESFIVKWYCRKSTSFAEKSEFGMKLIALFAHRVRNHFRTKLKHRLTHIVCGLYSSELLVKVLSSSAFFDLIDSILRRWRTGSNNSGIVASITGWTGSFFVPVFSKIPFSTAPNRISIRSQTSCHGTRSYIITCR